jgi:hypothetical protein
VATDAIGHDSRPRHVDISDDGLATIAGEQTSTGLANAAGATGDQRDLIF